MGEVAPTKAAFLRSLVEDLGGAEAAFLASLLGAQPAPAPGQSRPSRRLTVPNSWGEHLEEMDLVESGGQAGHFAPDYLDKQEIDPTTQDESGSIVVGAKFAQQDGGPSRVRILIDMAIGAEEAEPPSEATTATTKTQVGVEAAPVAALSTPRHNQRHPPKKSGALGCGSKPQRRTHLSIFCTAFNAAVTR